ncbi:MAG: glutamine--tRNA ligase/YqeY domain fusion protein [Granulosicoccus sp.]|nr:glutamine--tRNA ligase/YqeY domain fusion protein [Granulosicoccus sp.]
MSSTEKPVGSNFIRSIIENDLAANKNEGQVLTRFPPEPNGYLHIGHAKSICLNFGIAAQYGGKCNLRFDDTNPEKESVEYMEAIKRDVEWLGFEWATLRHASDYFDQLYDYAVELIKSGHAYVDSSSAEEMREMRGTLTEPGIESPFRNRGVEENLSLFEGMKAGEYDEGSHVLRAKIDMSSGNINMRDPTLYRIRKTHHFRTGDAWNIYPMYDYTHCLSDAIESITHSLCTLEFEDHRPLYDWVLDTLKTPRHPQQIEFARLSLEYTVLSKRKLIQLVEEGHVAGWDDPRMPTIAGLRRRGFTPASIRDFCERIGITKNDAWIEMAVLETSIRDDLNQNSERRLAVLDPVKVVITSLDEDCNETLDFANHPQNPDMGRRPMSFCRELYIEREDFAEIPPPKFQRLVPGGEVRLRGSYVIKCEEIIKDDNGNLIELRCTHDGATLGAKPEGRKVKGVIHWVSARTGVAAEVRLYDPLFNTENPGAADSFASVINPASITVMSNAVVEPALAQAAPEERFQFERLGYFVADQVDHSAATPVFNRTVTLRDTWAKK